MKTRGFVRLSVTLSALALVGAASCGTFGQRGPFRQMEDFRAYMCVNAPDASPQDLKKCAAQLSSVRSAPKVQHLTREAYWAEALGFALLMDAALAAFFLGIAWVSRWVARGFSEDAFGRSAKPALSSAPDYCLKINADTGRRSGGALFHRDPRALSRLPAASELVLSGSPAARE